MGTLGLTWLLAVILLGAQAAFAAPESSPPPDYRPPDTQGLCPALAEDYALCSEDQWSGNCAGFVTAAGRLGAIYRSELAAHPGWAESLHNTNWWGCGTAGLAEIKSMLQRIGTPAAQAVLAEEPYRSLGQRVLPPEPTARSETEPDCLAPASEAERTACAASRLARAKSRHERDFAACRQRAAPALRSELVAAEASWKQLLPVECAGGAYERDECLARAYEERSQSLATTHPECAAGAANPD